MFTLKEIALANNISLDAVRKRVQREAWVYSSTTLVNHAPAKLYAPQAIPADLRAALLTVPAPELPALPAPQLVETTLPAVITPEPAPSATPAPEAALPAVIAPEETMPAVTEPAPVAQSRAIPEAARRTALARLDLVLHWKAWRKEHPGSHSEADAEFERAYNAKQLYTGLYNILGETSIKTLYRWNSSLDNTTDWERLIPSWYGRHTAAVLTPEESGIFMAMLLSPSKVSIGSAYRLLKFKLGKQNIPLTHSPITFRRYAEQFKAKHYDIWCQMRLGEKANNDYCVPSISRDLSKVNVGDVLVADGHRFNFQVVHPITGKPCRATLVVYLDAKSYYPAGFEIMLEENTQCITSALRNAIINLGKFPKVCYQDNGRAFRSKFFTEDTAFDDSGMQGLMCKFGIIPVFAWPYHAQSKPVEGWFHNFGNTFERLQPSYTGASIEDKPAWLSRNEKFHKALHNEYLPEIPEIIKRIYSWLEFEGEQECPHVPGKGRRQVFEEGRGPGVDAALLDDLMLSTAAGQIHKNGITFRGENYNNDALYGLRGRLIIRYTHWDKDRIKLYLPTGEFLCEAYRPQPVHFMAKQLGTQADVQDLENEIAKIRGLKKQTSERCANIMRHIDLGWNQTDAIIVESEPQQSTALPAPDTSIHIPDPTPVSTKQASSRPMFMDEYERYEWILKNGEQTAADSEFVSAYKKTDNYKMCFEAHNC